MSSVLSSGMISGIILKKMSRSVIALLACTVFLHTGARASEPEAESIRVAQAQVAQFYFQGQLDKVLRQAEVRNCPILLKGVGQIVDEEASKSIIDGQC